MGAGLMTRLASIDRREAAWRAATGARNSLQRVAWRLQRPEWLREHISRLNQDQRGSITGGWKLRNLLVGP